MKHVILSEELFDTVISTDPIYAEQLSSKFFLLGTEDSFLFLESLKVLKSEEFSNKNVMINYMWKMIMTLSN